MTQDLSTSKKPIRKLPISLSNQIAAGEVVERPASILKELIENSIDSGANQIRIDIQQAGLEKITVTDNGCGIPVSELHLAVSPHATSKIHSQEQLGHINTLGFRGEALASIASVSKFEITSKVTEDDTAWTLDYSNKNTSSYDERDIKNLELIPAAHPVGTTVSANKIFYNTPARKKYLRTERTEYLHVERIIRQLILSDFDSAFVFIHNEREIYRFQAAHDMAAKSRRILKVCGKSFFDNSVTLNFKASGMTLTGWLAKSNFSKASADTQYFYINGRIIRDRVIYHAIRSVFQDKIPEGRYVAYVLYLTISTELIDVNVHPTKHEVRFDNMRLVHDFLSHVINQALHSNDINDGNSFVSQSSEVNLISEVKPNYYTAPRAKEFTATVSKKNSPVFFGTVLKIFKQQYLLTEHHSEIKLIEIKKAQSFLSTQNLTQQYTNTCIQSKPLMIPVSISLEPIQIDIIESKISILNELGIELTVTGLDSLLLRNIPVAIIGVDYIKLFKNIAVYLLATPKNEIKSLNLISVLCDAELIDSFNVNLDYVLALIARLNELDMSLLNSNDTNWWHTLCIEDFDRMLNDKL
ncbi:DNA mismatch repair protein MutL [hydrothermal vent metagenome]|uniref:DNA mismatch repair protein MutL n=1 Tax=hydrothermal vent metagenome TaxID=652676 RepID=A0A3B1AKD0_9ZZZZ